MHTLREFHDSLNGAQGNLAFSVCAPRTISRMGSQLMKYDLWKPCSIRYLPSWKLTVLNVALNCGQPCIGIEKWRLNTGWLCLFYGAAKHDELSLGAQRSHSESTISHHWTMAALPSYFARANEHFTQLAGITNLITHVISESLSSHNNGIFVQWRC